MSRELLVVTITIGGILAGIEMYLVKKQKINRWIMPIIVWAISLVIALLLSPTLVTIPSLLQVVMILCFYIEDYFDNSKNTENDKIKIKNL